ncbi:MAG: DUF1540 domain-containing protein [Oscillospiraceae bacterium]
MENSKNTLPGIICNVTDCEYHECDDKCSASTVNVGCNTTNCTTSCSTECVTFKPCNSCK